jgi:hypothetical protein
MREKVVKTHLITIAANRSFATPLFFKHSFILESSQVPDIQSNEPFPTGRIQISLFSLSSCRSRLSNHHPKFGIRNKANQKCLALKIDAPPKVGIMKYFFARRYNLPNPAFGNNL